MMTETASELVARIPDGATIAILGSGGGIFEPEELILALADRFEQTGHPRNLTLVHSMGLGDRRRRGLNPIAKPGLLKRVIGGHFGNSPELGKLINANLIEAYNIPLGVLSQLYRESAGGRPGLLTTVGIGTFADPIQGGGKLNDITQEDLVSRIEVDGSSYLLYRAPVIDFAFLKASAIDVNGNVTVADEPSFLDSLEIAAAARARHPVTGERGKVFVQVKKIGVQRLNPKSVHIPSVLVDGVVHVPNQWQSYDAEYDAGFAGEEYNPHAVQRPMEFGYRKLIARRAARELKAGDVANVGVGVPDGVPSVLAEEGRLSAVHMTNEHGIFGGVTSIGLTFGASRNHEAVVPMPIMIDLYQGGLLDVTFLGFAQIDAKGNVNVSKYGSEVTGAGGFIDITQNADTVVFCGSLTAGGLSIDYTDGTANVRQEGHTKKFIPRVEQITFSAEQALERGQRVLFVTERAVFELVKEGVQLVEIAPGIDIERDLLPNMDFKPIIGEVRPMDPSLFYEGVLV